MNTRFLGRTGVRVSEMCFGCMTFGPGPFNLGGVDQKVADSMVDRCLEAGVNFFDTADVYSEGLSEEMLGKALGQRRKNVLVATKAAARAGADPNAGGATRHHIMRSVEASLRRLNTDYIDLYQMHIWDDLTPLEETLRTLDDLVRTGKVRYIGCSNYSAWQVTKALWVSDRRGLTRFQTMQMQYSLLHREIEWEHVPLCQDQGLSVLVWTPLGGGFLTGKFRRGQEPKREWRRGDPDNLLNQLDFVRVDRELGFKILDVLDEIAKQHKATVAQVALAWVLGKPAIGSVLIGARTLDQLVDNLGAVNVQLTPEDVQKLDEVSALPPMYPYSMSAFMRTVR